MYSPENLAVYIHWPFCRSKCPYCDFYKELARNVDEEKIIAGYLDALRRYHELAPDRLITSVFFGGGTPSLISPQNIARLLDFIASVWNMSENPEISLEANPNTDSDSLFTDLKNAGINRLSLGVQALNENSLRFLGRTHSLNDARRCLEKITAVFENHSADLIYALPQQNIAEWQNELTEICSYGLRHLSLYQLTIEEGTVFARRNIEPLEEEKAAEMYEFTRAFLSARGYEMYEVSNFARKGFQSRHNLVYWQGGDYIGIGKSAHGRLTLNGKTYACEYPFMHQELTPEARAEELLITGLRLTRGVNKKTFQHITGIILNEFINSAALKELKELDLLTETADFLAATPAGMLLLNTVIKKLLI